MKIRAHHLLCIQGYQGYGYSNDFVINMNSIVNSIKSHENIEFELTSKCDDICKFCPHNINNFCYNNEEKIRNTDNIVLGTIGYKSGQREKISSLFSIVNKKFKSRSSVKEICGTCKWKEKCLWYSSKK